MSYTIPSIESEDVHGVHRQYIMYLKDDPEWTEEYKKAHHDCAQLLFEAWSKPKVPWTKWRAPKIKLK